MIVSIFFVIDRTKTTPSWCLGLKLKQLALKTLKFTTLRRLLPVASFRFLQVYSFLPERSSLYSKELPDEKPIFFPLIIFFNIFSP